VTAPIKYLVFKGIEKKEQILFKSFLNLAKNELAYQVVVLKDTDDSGQAPNIVILDEHCSDDQPAIAGLPTITIGGDINETRECYIVRPVQWSDFKTALGQLHIEKEVDGEDEVERLLPAEIEFAISESEIDEELSEPAGDLELAEGSLELAEGSLELAEGSLELAAEGSIESADAEGGLESGEGPSELDEGDLSEKGGYEYELDKMSVDYHSFTNSDYMKVVDDVKQFKEGEAPPIDEPVIMFTDDESASTNSVLVIETNSLDAWDFSESEISADAVVASAAAKDEPIGLEQPSESQVVVEEKAGLSISENEEYWLEDNEIIVDNESIFFIMRARDMVYSQHEPGKWPTLIKKKTLTKLPLKSDWRPKHDMRGYPMSDLQWVNTLVNETAGLLDGLDPEQEYMLESWPHFDLIQLDNMLLKLCTMLFVRGETIASLARKSGYSLSTVRGLVNACHQAGLIKKADEVQLEHLAASNDEGMFGKIKDVFR